MQIVVGNPKTGGGTITIDPTDNTNVKYDIYASNSHHEKTLCGTWMDIMALADALASRGSNVIPLDDGYIMVIGDKIVFVDYELVPIDILMSKEEKYMFWLGAKSVVGALWN